MKRIPLACISLIFSVNALADCPSGVSTNLCLDYKEYLTAEKEVKKWFKGTSVDPNGNFVGSFARQTTTTHMWNGQLRHQVDDKHYSNGSSFGYRWVDFYEKTATSLIYLKEINSSCVDATCKAIIPDSKSVQEAVARNAVLQSTELQYPITDEYYNTHYLAQWSFMNRDWDDETGIFKSFYAQERTITRYMPSVTVPAGTYNECIELKVHNVYTGAQTRVDFRYLCKGVGEVKRVDTRGRLFEMTAYNVVRN